MVVDRKLGHDLVIPQSHEFCLGVRFPELARHKPRVAGANAERYHAAGVAENRFLHVLVNLSDVLVGKRKIETVFTRFG